MRKRRGSLTITGSPVLLVVAAIALVVGLVVVAKLQPTITGLTGTANTTYTNIFTQTYAAFNLMVVMLIVLGAVAILLVVRLLQLGG